MNSETNTIFERIRILHNLQLKNLEVVRQFRGVTVLKTRIGDKLYALKYIVKNKISDDIDYDSMYRILSVTREAKILKDIKSDFNYYFLDDDDKDYSWIITHWIEGETSTHFMEKLKTNYLNDMKDENIISAFIKIVRRFSLLHDRKIIHGDVQPAHIIFNKANDVDLLDFGLSKYIFDEEFLYKGGLVHFNAPEIAFEMLKQANNIQLDIVSEIYSLGSVLFFLYTGKTSTYYGTDDYKSVPFELKLEFIIKGNRNTFNSSNSKPIANLEEILNLMMEPDRTKRCSDLKIIENQLKLLKQNI